MELSVAVGLVITMITVAGALPQPLRIWRLQTAQGVSAGTQAMTLCLCLGWGLYGILRQDPTQVVVNAVGLVGVLAVVGGMLRFDARRAILRTWPIIALFVAAICTVATVSGYVGVGVIASALSITFKLPQVALAWREPGGQGISVTGFTMSISCNALWLMYGLLVRDPAVIVTAMWGFGVNAFIISRTVMGRKMVPAVT